MNKSALLFKFASDPKTIPERKKILSLNEAYGAFKNSQFLFKEKVNQTNDCYNLGAGIFINR